MFPTYELKEKKRTRICVEFAQQRERYVCLWWIGFGFYADRTRIKSSKVKVNEIDKSQFLVFRLENFQLSNLVICCLHRNATAKALLPRVFICISFILALSWSSQRKCSCHLYFIFFLRSLVFFCLHSYDFDKFWRHLKAEWSVFHFFWFARTSNKLSGIFLRQRFNWCDLKTSKKWFLSFRAVFLLPRSVFDLLRISQNEWFPWGNTKYNHVKSKPIPNDYIGFLQFSAPAKIYTKLNTQPSRALVSAYIKLKWFKK